MDFTAMIPTELNHKQHEAIPECDHPIEARKLTWTREIRESQSETMEHGESADELIIVQKALFFFVHISAIP